MNNILEIINLIVQIILAFGVLIVFLQIKTQIRESRNDRTLEQLKQFEEKEFLKIRLFVLKGWDGKLPLKAKDELKIREFIHKMDILGALYLKRYIDRDFVRDIYAPFIVYSWYRCKPFIQNEKKKRRTKKYHEYFRVMHRHIMKSFNKKYPKNKIDIPINVFASILKCTNHLSNQNSMKGNAKQIRNDNDTEKPLF